MSDQAKAWVVIGDYGTLLCIDRQYAERDAATRVASGEPGVRVVELVEVVRCRDCKHDDAGDCPRIAREVHISNPDWHSEAEFTPDSRDWFCAYGEQ